MSEEPSGRRVPCAGQLSSTVRPANSVVRGDHSFASDESSVVAEGHSFVRDDDSDDREENSVVKDGRST